MMPAMFERILGHVQAIESLRAALRADRIHHAWIFHGPVGIGKYTTALAFAAGLLDPDAQINLAGEVDIDPDGTTAQLVRSGQHPDLHIISKELARFSEHAPTRDRKQTNIPIQVVRQFVVAPAARTGHGRSADTSSARATKVFIIDEAEMLDGRAQDTLLKTLEEPAPGTVLILVTSREHELSPTIRSRCRRLAFHPLTEPELDQWRDGLTDGLATDLTDHQWDDLKRIGRGSPGLVQTMMAGGMLGWLETIRSILAQLDDGRLPADAGPALAAHIEEFAQATVKQNKQASKDAANRHGVSLLFTMMAEEFRVRLAQSLAGSTNDPRAAMQVIRWIEYIELAQQQLSDNVNLKLVLDNLVIQLAGAASDEPHDPVCPGWFDTAGCI
ncbi:MAG: AAA family ATPase [Planctomycetes bacterium]|nr:AAA family ATPase [Planctomycetota bacterium]